MAFGTQPAVQVQDAGGNPVLTGVSITLAIGTNPSSGTLSGAFKEIETDPCTCGDYTDNWYQWNGSSWVLLSGPPSPSC